MSSAAKLEQLPTAKARTANGASQTAGSWASTLDQADPGSSSRLFNSSGMSNANPVAQPRCLSLAGPPLADRQELFDFIVAELKLREVAGVSTTACRALPAAG